MQTSLYAFIPLGVLLGIAFIAASISLWPRRRRQIATVPKKTLRSAEILHFPVRREQAPALPAARRHRNS